MSRIHLKIDRLVLNGLRPGQDKVFVETLRAQLLHILSDRASRGEWARSHRTSVLKLDPVPLETGTVGAAKLGKRIGQAVAKGLTP